jgi:hypothetical protein
MKITIRIPGNACQSLRPRAACPYFEAMDCEEQRYRNQRTDGFCNHPMLPSECRGPGGEYLCSPSSKGGQRLHECPFGRKPLVLTVEEFQASEGAR